MSLQALLNVSFGRNSAMKSSFVAALGGWEVGRTRTPRAPATRSDGAHARVHAVLACTPCTRAGGLLTRPTAERPGWPSPGCPDANPTLRSGHDARSQTLARLGRKPFGLSACAALSDAGHRQQCCAPCNPAGQPLVHILGKERKNFFLSSSD
jgi:hypothetical protein